MWWDYMLTTLKVKTECYSCKVKNINKTCNLEGGDLGMCARDLSKVKWYNAITVFKSSNSYIYFSF